MGKIQGNKWEVESTRRTNNEPTSTQLRLEGFRISIHRYIGCENVWFLSAYGTISLDKVELKSKDLEEAKKEALLYLGNLTNALNQVVQSAMGKETVQ